MQQGYPPQQQGYPPQQQGYPPQQQMQPMGMQPMQQQPQMGFAPQQQVQHQPGSTGSSSDGRANGAQPVPMQQPMQQPQPQMQQPMQQPQPQMQQPQPQMQRPPMQQPQPGGPPIVLQGGEQWMVVPVVPVGLTIPPGLEYLLPCAGAHVRQKTDLIEVFTNIDTPNKYGIYNDQGQFMYFAKEQQDIGGFVAAQLLGDNRGFHFTVTDGLGRHAFSISRSSKLWTDCEMIVEAPPGIPAGFVSYNSSLCSRGVLTVFDAGRRPVLSVPFPSECDCGGDRGYMVVSGGATVGAITRKYPGFMKAAFTNCDNFALNFPVDLDVRVKCTLLACAIMIDFIDFEDKRDNRTNNRYNNGI